MHAGFAIQSIIGQNTIAPELPDFRNLGTILRVVLAVNVLTAVAAMIREPQLELWVTQWAEMTALVAPQLTLELAVLYAATPWLLRQSYRTGVLLTSALTIVVAVAVLALISRQVPDQGLGPIRYVVFSLGVYAVLLAYFRLRAKALSPAIAESRLQALQARIRPHFLFNSINAVLSLVRSDPKQAETALLDMADLFRVLMRDNRHLVPLADEIELCRQYLALEKLRLSERLQIEWHLKNMPGDALVPPLVLQPLLENAIYHGIEPSSTPGVISINIFYKGGEVHAILRNPYEAEGGRHHGGNKMAMANIRERLKLHFDAEGALESRIREATYEVHIRMPYRTTDTSAARESERARPAAKGNQALRVPPPPGNTDAATVVQHDTTGVSRG